MSDLTRLSATKVLALLKDGTFSVEQYARSLLARIDQRDDVVRAWAFLDPDLIISAARRLDKIPLENRGPIHGLPIGIKDVAQTIDMPTRHNSEIYKDEYRSSVDAAAIITLRAAGALIFGKTTTTEFAATNEGGPCTNPRNPAHTPGGSSSGSGAAVADFQVPVALGTQTGGSMIRPGSYNGVYAFKPTWGAISREGLAQFSITCDTAGFFARNVEDLEILANVFQLSDDTPIPSAPFEIKGANIGFLKTHAWSMAGQGLQAAWDEAHTLLSNDGAIVKDLFLPDEFEHLARWHSDIIAAEGRAAFLGNYKLAKEKLHPSIAGYVDNISNLSRKAQLKAYDSAAQLRPIWDSYSGKFDVIITPSVPDEAPRGLQYTGPSCFCAMWTLLHAPAVNIPGFSGRNGMPIGLSIVGPRYHDRHLLYVARSLGLIFNPHGEAEV